MTEKVTELKQVDDKKMDKTSKIKRLLKGYEMRELQANDIFKIVEIINILNVTDLVTEFFKQQDAAKIKVQKAQGLAVIAGQSDDQKKESLSDQIKSLQEDVSSQSFDYISKAAKYILSHASEIKTELNGLLADLTDKTVDEIGETNIVTYSLLVKDFFVKPELREVFELLF